MALIATREDFEPQTPLEREAALYWTPNTNEAYRDYPFFAERIAELSGRFAPSGQKTLIAGCGFGYAVQYAVQTGYDAYGCDASAYAIGRGQALMPAIASRLLVGNVLSTSDLNAVRAAAGLPGNQRFRVLVTEDLLTVLTDAENVTAVNNLRAICLVNLLHIVTPNDSGGNRDPRCNWKGIQQWRGLLCPPDLVMDAETKLVWDASGQV